MTRPEHNKETVSARQQLALSHMLTPLGLAVCLSLFGDLALYASLVTQIEEVGLSLGAVGIMLGINRLIRIPGNPLAGMLIDRLGRRRLFLLGMLLGTLSTAGYGLVRGFWPFLTSRLVWGIAWTLINVSGMAMVLDTSTPANRGRLTGLYNTWMLSGLALGPLVGGFLVDLIGFRPAMLTCAGITSVGLMVVVVALPETTTATQEENVQRERRLALNRRRHPGEVWHSKAKTWFRTKQDLVTASSLYLITQFAGEGVVLSTVSLLLQKHTGEIALGVASAGGLLLALRSLLAGAVGPLAGGWSDGRFGRWSVIRGSLVIGILGFGLLSLATSLGLIILGVALGAVSAGAALATLTAYVGDRTTPGKQGTTMGIYATAGDLGSTTGPFLAFALLSVIDLHWVYLFCSLTFLLGLGLSWRSRGAWSSNPSFFR